MYNIEELKLRLLSELKEIAENLGVKNFKKLNKQDLIYAILDQQAITPDEKLPKKADSEKTEEKAPEAKKEAPQAREPKEKKRAPRENKSARRPRRENVTDSAESTDASSNEKCSAASGGWKST